MSDHIFKTVKFTQIWDGVNDSRRVKLLPSNFLKNILNSNIGKLVRISILSKITYRRFSKPRSPIPRKSVLGSSPWKPISFQLSLTRASSGRPGISKSHSSRSFFSCSGFSESYGVDRSVSTSSKSWLYPHIMETHSLNDFPNLRQYNV